MKHTGVALKCCIQLTDPVSLCQVVKARPHHDPIIDDPIIDPHHSNELKIFDNVYFSGYNVRKVRRGYGISKADVKRANNDPKTDQK